MRYYGQSDAPEPPLELLGGKLRFQPVPFYESGEGVTTTAITPWHDAPSFFMDDLREVGMPHVAVQSEYFVPLDAAADALAAVRAVASRWPGWPLGEADLGPFVPVFHCEVRAIKADGLGGVAPFQDRDTLSIHFTWGAWDRHGPAILGMVGAVEAALLPFEPRPHMGKLNVMPHRAVAANFPPGAVAAFRDLAETHDPRGKFRNALVRKQVWGDAGDLDGEYPVFSS